MNDLQVKVLELLEEIDKLCRENEIEYYLTAGTLLGALRHKGFIPWDDDADIIMTRDNWEKFLERTRGKLPDGRVVLSQYDDPNRTTVINNYINANTAALTRHQIINPEVNGILVDVIIMDPVPDKEDAKKEYIRALTAHMELSTIQYQYSLRIGESTHFARYKNLSKIFGMKRVLEYIDRKAFHYKDEDSYFYVQRYAGSPHFWPKEFFGKAKYVPFETTMLPVPQRAEECLCIGFDDDWMYVPRGGDTKSKHDYCLRSFSIPGTVIGTEFERHIDRKKLMATYEKKKKIQVAHTDEKFETELKKYQFISSYIRMVYEEKLKNINLGLILEEKNYKALDDVFKQYIEIQCDSLFIGSSTITGWIKWYHKCHPVLIDIGDEALYVVLFLLVHKQKLAWFGKLLKARKELDRPLPMSIQKMDELYGAIKAAINAYDAGKHERCRELLARWLPEYPDNPFLWKLYLKEQVLQGLDHSTLLERADTGLSLFPDDPELMLFKAESLFGLAEQKQALAIYRALAETTNHGLVLLQMKEHLEALRAEQPDNRDIAEIWLEVRRAVGEEDVPSLEALLEEEASEDVSEEDATSEKNEETEAKNDEDGEMAAEETLSTEPSEASALHTLTAVQEKRLQLLKDLDDICRKNKIAYVLAGKALYQAERFHQYLDPNGDLMVYMTVDNCQKFKEAVKCENREDRFIESMEENPDFYRFCVRYGDRNSLDFDVNLNGHVENCGIFVTIEILRYESKSRLENMIIHALERGWEARASAGNYTYKIRLCRIFVAALRMVFGQRRIAQWLYRLFSRTPKKANKGRYFIKGFRGMRQYFPNHLFRYTYNVCLEDKSFMTTQMSAEYLKRVYGAKWKTRAFPYAKSNPFMRVLDADIPYEEYLKYLREHGIDREKLGDLRRRTQRKLAPVAPLNQQTDYYWSLLVLCGERFRLAEKYLPMRLYLVELRRSMKVPELWKELGDYYRTALRFSKLGMGVCFDRQIFGMLEYCLIRKGKAKQAELFRNLIPEQDWKTLELPYAVEEKGMRQATAKDIPAILVYLKRNVQDCIYMYIDIAKYGLENPHMKVWLDSNRDGVKLVVMKYHTSISVYTDQEKWDEAAVTELIQQEKVGSVTSRKDIIEKLYARLDQEYHDSYGWIFNFTNNRDYGIDSIVETATEDDALEIAKLITIDEGIGGYYEVQDLADQLAERMRTNMGRSYVIRDQGRIVAHIASYAEFDDIATTGGLIVHPDCRTGVYGAALESYLARKLREEGFKVYAFIQNRLRYKLAEIQGNQCVAEYGKLARIQDEEGNHNDG